MKKHSVRAGLIALFALVIVLIILSILGYIFNWDWTGLGPYISPPHPKDSDFQRSKTLWDWLQLLIIPLALAIIAIFFNRAERKNEQRVASDNQQQSALQEYLGRMTELLLEKNLRKSEMSDEVRGVARARTLSTLSQLNGLRKRNLIQFLSETDLLRIISLKNADLSDASLSYANLRGANLYNVNLNGADLYRARLSGSDLQKALLNDAFFREADLSSSNLSNAQLRKADLRSANLRGANLHGADLRKANLRNVDLSETYLYEVDLRGAIATEEQLKKAKSLKGATMPDGSIHP